MAALTPDQLMEEYCYKPSSATSGTSSQQFLLELTPQETLDFGNWATTTISEPKEFQLKNLGYDDVVISRFELVGDFQFLDQFPITVKAGETYTGRLYFAPTGVGSRVGLFAVDAELASGDRSLRLTGTGWAITDPDIQGIVNEPGLTLDTFPYWDDQLDIIVNTDLPESLG